MKTAAAIIAAFAVIVVAPAVAHADHNTGALIELRYSPESDADPYPLANDWITVGYMDRRFAFGLTVGFNRITTNDPTSIMTLTQQFLTIGPTVRGSFFTTADGRTELVGEGTATYTSVTNDVSFSDGSNNVTPSPLRFEVGIGVRHWLIPELAIGVAALVRYTTAQVGPQTLTQESLGGAIYLSATL